MDKDRILEYPDEIIKVKLRGNDESLWKERKKLPLSMGMYTTLYRHTL
jgi:hypothetical protein